MKRILIGSARSPFVRIVRLFLINHDLPFEFRVLNYLDNPEDAKTLAQENPVNKIPILIENEQKIFDSRVIVNHLIHSNGLRRLSLNEENIVTAVYGATDTSVSLFLLQREAAAQNGNGLNENSWYMQRQQQRIKQCLDFVEPWMKQLSIEKKQDWDYPSMSLYSYLYWGQARGLLGLDDYPFHREFLERFKQARGLNETGF